MSERLLGNLKRRAIAWAGQITSLAKGFAPAHLKPYVRSRVEEKNNGGFIIRTTVNRGENPKEKYGTLDARAQEFGSGERAKRGPKQKYPIVPKKGKFLAFQWDVAEAHPEVARFLPDGRFIITKVNHPGIPPANGGLGYIAPAIKEVRKRARQDLSKDIREAILGDLRQSFGRK